MEEIRSSENREGELRSRLVEGLKTKGYQDPEVKQVLTEWIVLQEEKVPLGEGRTEGQVRLQIAQAELCLEAELKEEAFELLESAHLQAYQESMDLLIKEIESKIENL